MLNLMTLKRYIQEGVSIMQKIRKILPILFISLFVTVHRLYTLKVLF